jgi:hypothetical protein
MLRARLDVHAEPQALAAGRHLIIAMACRCPWANSGLTMREDGLEPLVSTGVRLPVERDRRQVITRRDDRGTKALVAAVELTIDAVSDSWS